MKISFDLDGTAWKYRKEFSALAHILKASGHEVGILTAHSMDLMHKDIELWKARGYPDPDFYICNSGNWPVVKFKAEAMLESQIDLHFEDFDAGNYEKAMMDILPYGTVVRIK